MLEICQGEPIRKMMDAILVLEGITEVERNAKVIVPTVSLEGVLYAFSQRMLAQ